MLSTVFALLGRVPRADVLTGRLHMDIVASAITAEWQRFADRLATVVADTSMITLSTAYASHFHDIYIDGKEKAKMTGDRMKMLMLTLPFMVRDLIAPEVIVCTGSYSVVPC